MTTRMTVARRDYLLADNTDIEALQVEMCRAMRRGSGMVRVDLMFSAPITFLVSAGVPVSFELVAEVIETETAPEDSFSIDDWEALL